MCKYSVQVVLFNFSWATMPIPLLVLRHSPIAALSDE